MTSETHGSGVATATWYGVGALTFDGDPVLEGGRRVWSGWQRLEAVDVTVCFNCC